MGRAHTFAFTSDVSNHKTAHRHRFIRTVARTLCAYPVGDIVDDDRSGGAAVEQRMDLHPLRRPPPPTPPRHRQSFWCRARSLVCAGQPTPCEFLTCNSKTTPAHPIPCAATSAFSLLPRTPHVLFASAADASTASTPYGHCSFRTSTHNTFHLQHFNFATLNFERRHARLQGDDL